jgi:hypothetical protein
MIGMSAITLYDKVLGAISNQASTEHVRLRTIAKEVMSYPIKALAAFIIAPILVMKVALTVKNPLRRTVAIVGLLLALLLSYVAGTALGGFAGFLIIASSIGWLAAVGFAVGTFLSVVLSVTFSIFVFNLVSYIFLKMSSQEVLDYLKEVSS